MNAIFPIILGLGLLFDANAKVPVGDEDTARLKEMLQDRLHPRQQSQAALLLLQGQSSEAVEAVREGLRQTESPEVFTALAGAVRLGYDRRFLDELFAALSCSRPAVRQEAAETLAMLADANLVARLQSLAKNDKADLGARQAAIMALGRSGSKGATVLLLDQLTSEQEVLRRAAAEALTELTGQSCGTDTARWRAWWEGHRDVSDEGWLGERLAYQVSRANRLEGELERTKTQVVQLHQQLYGRLPAADRLGHLQTLGDHDAPAVRALAVTWSAELLPAADAIGQKALAEILLNLSRDSSVDVQRPAVLALGRVADPRAFERLQVLLRRGRSSVRAAAARSLAQQAKLTRPQTTDPRAIQYQVVPALQKALEDTSLEVVIEAAEDLGSLGLPEAVPVLTALLHHPSEMVRRTAAQALERVADASVLDDLLAALDDSVVTVRFSLVGALGQAAGDGKSLSEAQRARLLSRLEGLLTRDTDPGVRSRAATVLGECGPPSVLPTLWKRVAAAEDGRVQDKAWGAINSIVARAGNIDLLTQWDRAAAEAKLTERRMQFLVAVVDAWKKNNDTKSIAAAATEVLVQAQLNEGKWAAAYPFVRELLAQPGTDADVGKRLQWLLTVAQQALKEGNRAEALRATNEAQAHLPRSRSLAPEFEKVEKQAQQEKRTVEQ